MQVERLNHSHQSLLRKQLQSLELDIAEYSFANLYLFRNLHQYELVFAKDTYIQGLNREGAKFVMLTTPPHARSIPELLSLLKPPLFLFPIPSQWLPLFGPSLVQASFKEEDSDYLFEIEKLASFPGRHLSKKRNLVRQLFNDHQIDVRQVGPEQKQDALKVLDDWQLDQLQDVEETDYFPCKEAIELLEVLSLEARLTYIDEKPCGLTIGGKLNTDCHVIHFTKADKQIKGLYQHLYQDYAKSLQHQHGWINLEQDLGSPALRQAKHSYSPDRMVQKMRVYLA